MAAKQTGSIAVALVVGVAIGFVGTTLDYVGKGAQRWDRWRPSVGLCQQDDIVIHRLELLHDARSRGLFERLRTDIAAVSPETEVRSVEITLRDNEYTRSMWDFPFEVHYSVTLHGEDLMTEYRVVNTGDKSFSFQSALHSYFEVVDIKLWEKSGHADKFGDDMFMTESENRTYAIKPMNCPCHVQIFNQGLVSYRDLDS